MATKKKKTGQTTEQQAAEEKPEEQQTAEEKPEGLQGPTLTAAQLCEIFANWRRNRGRKNGEA